jgi:hypothetical protein
VIALLAVLAIVAPAERPMAELEVSGGCGIEHVAVYSSGFAHFEKSDTCGTSASGSGLRRISDADLQNVRAAIAASAFETLPTQIQPDPRVVGTEEDLFTVRVWRNGTAKEVQGFALDRATDQQAATRFKALCIALEKFGPEGK